MNHPSFMFQGLFGYEDSDSPDTFYHVPGEPSPERDPQGKPTLSLLALGDTAILKLGAQWGPEEKTLDAFRRDIVDEFSTRRLTLSTIRLIHSPITMRSADLVVTCENGRSELLQSVATSGFPPFMAIFNVRLNAVAKASVIRALHGSPYLLTVKYRGCFTSPLPLSASISGDARDEVRALRPSSTVAEARALVDRALASGQFTRTRHSPRGMPTSIENVVEEEVRMAAAKALGWLVQRQATVADPEVLRFAVMISKTLNMELPFDITTDVSAWFPRAQGNTHIRAVNPMYETTLDKPADPQLRRIMAEQDGDGLSDTRRKGVERTPLPIQAVGGPSF
ncbi:MAG: hypothetical protein H8K03_14965 [Nitrospira sp.]